MRPNAVFTEVMTGAPGAAVVIVPEPCTMFAPDAVLTKRECE